MREILRQFRIRRDERLMAIAFLLVFLALHGLVIYHYNDIFMNPSSGYWARFLHHFHLSGYDPITYSVVTIWTAKYNVYRHPLLAFFVAPLYWLNSALMSLTGVNCVQYVVAVVWLVFDLYAFLFAFRIMHDIIGTGRKVSLLLAAMLFGFANVMLAAIVPDHFILSMMLILLTVYICGMKMKEGREVGILQTVVLFFLTAGVTLSNGVKVFICTLFTKLKGIQEGGLQALKGKQGRSLLVYLLVAVLLPSAIIWVGARLEYHYLVLPQEKIAHAKRAADNKRKQEAAAKKKAEAEKTFQMQLEKATTQGDTTLAALVMHRLDSIRTAKPKARRNPNGRPIAKGEFMRWTDISTSRGASVVENLLGEGLMFHQDYLLDDVLRHRPVIVPYRTALPYVVETILLLFFLGGLWCGRRSRFLWMLMACVAFDMLLHLGLGFGLNEVYIMTAHWAFIIPFAMAYLFKTISEQPRIVLRALCMAVTVLLCAGLWAYNAWLLAGFLLK